ncbi:MAG: hypothetical protein OXC81_07960, partial [Betaproteobacteria bacterium]|nr:hypothetical protein [Betaproteobacteria bacterium]
MVDPAPKASSIKVDVSPRPEGLDKSASVKERKPTVTKRNCAQPSGVHLAGAISQATRSVPSASAAAAFAPAGNGPVNDANQLVAILVAKKSTGADLLRGLAQTVGTKPSGDPRRAVYEREFDRQLHKALAGLTAAQRNRIATRLASPAVAALRHALREGIGRIDLRDRPAAAHTILETGRQLAQLQKFFAVAPGTPGNKDHKQARQAVDDFARQFDAGRFQQAGKFTADDIAELRMDFELFAEPNLNRDPASRIHGQVSRDFVNEAAHKCCLLENEDGRCQWLVAPHLDGMLDDDSVTKLAAERLLDFCGGDEQACLAVSRAATRRVAQAADVDLAARGITGSDAAPVHDKELLGFMIKKSAEGNYQVIARSSSQLSGEQRAGELRPLNANQSHWHTEATVSIGADRVPKLEGISYDFCTAAHLGKVASDQQASSVPFDQQAAAAELLAQQQKVSVYGDFSALPVNEDEVRANSTSSAADLAGRLVAKQILNQDQSASLLSRLEFVDDARRQIDAIDIGSEEGIEQLSATAGDLVSDLRLLQEDLLLKAQVWGVDLNEGQRLQLNTLLVKIADALGGEAARIELLAADRAAALDDGRGAVNEVVANSLLARSENAFRQASANILAATRITDEIASGNAQLSEAEEKALDDLIGQLDRRASARQAALHEAKAGRVDPDKVASGGVKKKDLSRHERPIRNALAAGEPLPEFHRQLSETQLFRLQIDHLVSNNPGLARFFSDFNARYAEASADLLASAGWAQINSSFHDIDENGRLHKLTSTITPGPQFAEANLRMSYQGLGVACGNRTQGRHTANLAHSQIVNENDQVVFAGLRHGILDSYGIVADELVKMPEAKLRDLIGETLAADDQWLDLVRQRYGEGRMGIGTLLARSVELIRSGDSQVLQLAAERARSSANFNAARELATAAVVANPVLLSRALIDREVTVDLDSVSLVTPDRLRETGNKEAERTYLANQIAALNALAQKPFTARIDDGYGNSREVQVTVRPRMFNFGVNAYAVGSSVKQRLAKPFMGWQDADRLNRESLTAMIGDPNQIDAVGGEAGRMLAWLEGGGRGEAVPEATQVMVSAASRLDGSSQRQQTAFDDAGRRAEAIRTVVGQIKAIFSSGSHRRGGNEPYKLAARVALLSNLLGRSACFNCKSGKDRTGQMDAAVKQLAVDAAAGSLPEPDAVPNQRRTTNFVLKTGNLEMQQHNTGLTGYKLAG